VLAPFNATVAKALAERIDPSLPGKTLTLLNRAGARWSQHFDSVSDRKVIA
jgi:hypothetical protein